MNKVLEYINNLTEIKESDVLHKGQTDFLKDFGFTSSEDVLFSQRGRDILDIRKRYQGKYRFITEEQLDEICTQFDLYFRELKHYSGKIPSKNVNDIRYFKVFCKDLTKEHIDWNKDILFREDWRFLSPLFLEHQEQLKDKLASSFLEEWAESDKEISLSNSLLRKEFFSIACTKDLLTPEAFKDSKKRIISNKIEMVAIDPIIDDPLVLFKIKNGYLIVTAWGAEQEAVQ